MWEDAKVMTEAIPRHFSCLFLGESSTSFQDLASSNRAFKFAQKYNVHHHSTYAQCRLSSRSPASWSNGRKTALSWLSARGAKSTRCTHPLIFLRKNRTYLRHQMFSQSSRHSCLKFTIVTEIVNLKWVLSHFWGDSDVDFLNLFNWF